MKKVVAIFFLSFFCLCQTGHFIFYSIRLWQIKNTIRNEIIAGVPDRYLDAVEYSSQIKWEEEGKEFILKNEFYDVVRIKKVKNKTILYCLNDKKEEQLVTNFAKTIKSATDNERGKNNKHFFNFQLMEEQRVLHTSVIYLVNIIKPCYCLYVAALRFNSKEVIIPPPWFI